MHDHLQFLAAGATDLGSLATNAKTVFGAIAVTVIAILAGLRGVIEYARSRIDRMFGSLIIGFVLTWFINYFTQAYALVGATATKLTTG